MTAPKPDLLDAIKALADEWERRADDPHRTGLQGESAYRHAVAEVRALLAGATTSETVEALEACREQRSDLLALLEVEREQHATALVQAWHQGYGAGSSDATDGWLKPGSPRTANPYPTPAPVPTEGGEQP